MKYAGLVFLFGISAVLGTSGCQADQEWVSWHTTMSYAVTTVLDIRSQQVTPLDVNQLEVMLRYEPDLDTTVAEFWALLPEQSAEGDDCRSAAMSAMTRDHSADVQAEMGEWRILLFDERTQRFERDGLGPLAYYFLIRDDQAIDAGNLYAACFPVFGSDAAVP